MVVKIARSEEGSKKVPISFPWVRVTRSGVLGERLGLPESLLTFDGTSFRIMLVL